MEHYASLSPANIQWDVSMDNLKSTNVSFPEQFIAKRFRQCIITTVFVTPGNRDIAYWPKVGVTVYERFSRTNKSSLICTPKNVRNCL